jgi:hypothetical protein
MKIAEITSVRTGDVSAAGSAYWDASTAVLSAWSEVDLIAPREVRLWANALFRLTPYNERDGQKPFEFGEVRAQLLWVMREDLGEPGPEEDQADVGSADMPHDD